MRNTLTFFCVAATVSISAQRVLHFTATSGYDHGTRDVSFAMFSAIASELDVELINDQTGATFSDANALGEYDAVIFSNTSGNTILDAAQRSNFEQWVNAGGHVLGIHAASDTYRHSTANGNNTGTWDFYAELIGASVQENPNHVSGTPPYAMMHLGEHPSTANLPDPWLKNEEYYYWEGGYFGPDNHVVLEVEETTGPNGQVNSYDAPRPMSWYRELESGSRIFYTALGHATSNYTEDELFRQHVKDALRWMLDITTGVPEQNRHTPRFFPNPANETLHIRFGSTLPGMAISLFDASGRMVLRQTITSAQMELSLVDVVEGPYVIVIGDLYRSSCVVLR